MSLVIDQEYRPEISVEELTEHPENPRRGSDEAVAESIETHGFYGAILVQRSTGFIIGGNTRYRRMVAAGESSIPGFILDVDDETALRILLADNRTSDLAGYDDAGLIELLSALSESGLGLEGTGYDEDAFAALIEHGTTLPGGDGPDGGSFGDDYGDFSGIKLADRFLAPPFSVLDGRAGYWRARKRYWIEEVGIRSETGREENLLNQNARMLQSAQWRGTSVFDPVLCELMYRWYGLEGGHVIDPFCGGSVRGLVAAACEMSYEGYDLRPEQIAANEANARRCGIPPDHWPDWKVGDSAAGEYRPGDLLLTCPPYWSLERYSDDALDLSAAADITAFAEGYRACLEPAAEALRDDRFAVVVIASMREHGSLWDLGGLTIEILRSLGLSFYNDGILLTPLASAALRSARLFSTRKLVPVHQRVLVFAKGDPLAAIAEMPEVEIMRDEMQLASWLDPEGGEMPDELIEEDER